MGDATEILLAVNAGASGASEQLFGVVYEELRKLAAHRLVHEAPGQTLQATALVHEVYLRLVDQEKKQHWEHRGHFFAAAAKAMDRILVDQARRKNAIKRGGELARVDAEICELPCPVPDELVLTLHDAINTLEQIKADAATIVRLRFFTGMTNREAAQAMRISPRTADNLWSFARAWLYDRMGDVQLP